MGQSSEKRYLKARIVQSGSGSSFFSSMVSITLISLPSRSWVVMAWPACVCRALLMTFPFRLEVTTA